MWDHTFSFYKLFTKNKLKKAWRLAWFFSILVLFSGCIVSTTELRTIRFPKSTPILCLEDELTLITISGYRFQKPVSHRLHKTSVFSALAANKLKSDSTTNKTFFSSKTFLSILVIVLFYYYYHSAGEEGEKSASNLIEVLNS